MGWSPLSTEVHNTAQYSARNQPVRGVVLHHGATTSADQIISMEVSGSRQVSSHQVVKDSRIAGIVQEQFRAWSLSDADWDSWAMTVECANESTAGWTISQASHESLARLVADWATRYGFYPHRNGDPRTWTVIGHREVYTIHGGSYATACPGGMNLDWIAARAQQLIAGGGNRDMSNKVWVNITTDDAKAATGIGKGSWVEIDGSNPMQLVPDNGVLLDVWSTEGIQASPFSNTTRVYARDGKWLLQRLAAEKAAYALNLKMHPWLANSGSGAPGVPADLQPLLDALEQQTTELKSDLLAALAAGDTKVLAAIDKVDEATLATFGLKRA